MCARTRIRVHTPRCPPVHEIRVWAARNLSGRRLGRRLGCPRTPSSALERHCRHIPTRPQAPSRKPSQTPTPADVDAKATHRPLARTRPRSRSRPRAHSLPPGPIRGGKPAQRRISAQAQTGASEAALRGAPPNYARLRQFAALLCACRHRLTQHLGCIDARTETARLTRRTDIHNVRRAAGMPTSSDLR